MAGRKCVAATPCVRSQAGGLKCTRGTCAAALRRDDLPPAPPPVPARCTFDALLGWASAEHVSFIGWPARQAQMMRAYLESLEGRYTEPKADALRRMVRVDTKSLRHWCAARLGIQEACEKDWEHADKLADVMINTMAGKGARTRDEGENA